jgi:hypothetical protein
MFDLNDASEKLATSYQKPGITNIKITGVVLEESSKAKVPFITLTTESEDGSLGKSGRMFLSTEVKEGKKASGWSVTARNLVDLIMAGTNKTEEEAKALIKVDTKEQLVAKLSAILVGTKMRAKFKGETSDRGTVFATIAQVESLSIPADQSNLKFDPIRDIKPATGTSVQTVSAADTTSDLPF